MDHHKKKSEYFVAGRGFCGLAIAYFLKKKHPEATVRLFDPNPISKSASAAASGILEPIGGRLVVRSMFATEGLKASKDLLDVVSCHLQEKVYVDRGVYHYPIDEKQACVFQKKGDQHQEYYFFDSSRGLFVKEGINVFSQKYIEGLFSLVLSMGVEFIPEKVPSSITSGKIFLAIGSNIDQILPNQFRLTRGQALQVEKGTQSFNEPVVHKGYIALDPNPNVYHVGSTYERDNLDLPANPDRAIKELYERNEEVFTEIRNLKIISVKSGIRVFQRDDQKVPKILQLDPDTIALSGMGSKGLLYHAIYAEKIVNDFS